ncbi:MAG TPA: DUF1178 family protein [Rhizobiales bacterium]|nr:DUF1178 family protein [Hyphomicrobiales bacterium]
MIRYRLKCDKAHEFDGWFANSGAFDEQVDQGQLSCPRCGSIQVIKALMAPSIARSGKSANRGAEALRKARDEMLRNADNVGDEFACEARKIHYKDAEPRGIYGRATDEEAKALREEGVDFYPLPTLPEDHN